MSATTNAGNQRSADLVRDAAIQEAAEILQRLNTSPDGLSEEEAANRLESYRPQRSRRRKKSTTGCSGSGWPCAIRW